MRWVILLLQPGDRAKTNTKLNSMMVLAESLQVSGQLEVAGPNGVWVSPNASAIHSGLGPAKSTNSSVYKHLNHSNAKKWQKRSIKGWASSNSWLSPAAYDCCACIDQLQCHVVLSLWSSSMGKRQWRPSHGDAIGFALDILYNIHKGIKIISMNK
jgi:hypothetical protein